MEPLKKQKRKFAFSLMAIVLVVSLCIGILVEFWSGQISTSNRINHLSDQLSAIQEQISNFQATLESSNQNQSDVLEAISSIKDELSKIQDEIFDLESSSIYDQDPDEIMKEISGLKSQFSTLQEQISRINETSVIYKDIIYIMGENASLSMLFEQVKHSVVVVQALIAPSTTAQGSGFFYNYSGQMIILTNNHVIQDALSIDLTFSNGNTYSAVIIGSNPNTDVAVLTTNAPQTDYNPLSIVSSSTLKVGDPVVVVGTPYGLPGSMSNGIVSALNRTITLEQTMLTNIIQTTTPLNPGNSGGPMINYIGQVVGMATAIVEDSQGIGFAIPSDTILQNVIDIMS